MGAGRPAVFGSLPNEEVPYRVDTALLRCYGHPRLALDVVTLSSFLAGEEWIQRQTRLLKAVPDFNVRKRRNRDKLLLVEGGQRGINAILRAHDVLLGEIVYRKAARSQKSVRVAPGRTACTCTPVPLRVLKRDWVKFRTYAFVPLYVPFRASGLTATTEEMLMTAPSFFAIKFGRTAALSRVRAGHIQEDHVLQLVHAGINERLCAAKPALFTRTETFLSAWSLLFELQQGRLIGEVCNEVSTETPYCSDALLATSPRRFPSRAIRKRS